MKIVIKAIRLAAVLLALNLSQCTTSPVLTTFNISEIPDDASEFIILKYNFEQEKMDTLKSFPKSAASDTYRFSETFTEPAIYQLRSGNGQRIRIAVEQAGTIDLKWGRDIEIFSEVAVISDFGKTIGELNQRFFADLKDDYDTAIREEDRAKLDKLETIKDELLVDFVNAMEQEVRTMGPSAAAYDALSYFDLHKNFTFLQEMNDRFRTQFPHAGMTLSLTRNLNRAAAVAEGGTAPEFTGRDLESKVVALKDFEGKYLLIDFWASWCRACRVENPKLAAIRNEYIDKGFDMISISQDTEITPYKKAIEKDGISWPQIHDADRTITELYLVSSLPSNFLLDPEGKIIAKNINAKQLSAILDDIL